MKQLTAVLALAIVLASCNQFDKTKSGMPYKITKGGSTALLKNGSYVVLNLEFKLGSKDSILNNTFGKIPVSFRFDTAQLGKYNFTEVLPKCAVGDVINFTLSIDTLKNLGAIPDFDKTFTKGGVIKGKVEILASFDNQAGVSNYMNKAFEAEKAREIKDLDAYAAAKGYKTEKTPSGAEVVIENAGDLSNKADSGKEVTVLYKGYTVDGKVFDSNIDKAGAPPFKVIVGERKVIPGWDEGLRLFAKGRRGKILVPAMLGYGERGGGPIKPYSNLIFDVQIVDVATPAPAPPAAAAPGMNPQMMMHGHK